MALKIKPISTGGFDKKIEGISKKLHEIITSEVIKLKGFNNKFGNNEINGKIKKLEKLRDNLVNEIKKLIFIE